MAAVLQERNTNTIGVLYLPTHISVTTAHAHATHNATRHTQNAHARMRCGTLCVTFLHIMCDERNLASQHFVYSMRSHYALCTLHCDHCTISTHCVVTIALRCSHCTHCVRMHCVVTIALRCSHCAHCIICITLWPLHWDVRILCIALYALRCDHCIEMFAFCALHYMHYVVTIALRCSHCAHCFICIARTILCSLRYAHWVHCTVRSRLSWMKTVDNGLSRVLLRDTASDVEERGYCMGL